MAAGAGCDPSGLTGLAAAGGGAAGAGGAAAGCGGLEFTVMPNSRHDPATDSKTNGERVLRTTVSACCKLKTVTPVIEYLARRAGGYLWLIYSKSILTVASVEEAWGRMSPRLRKIKYKGS